MTSEVTPSSPLRDTVRAGVRDLRAVWWSLVTLVGVWAIFHGVSEIFAAFTLREAGKRAEQLVR